MVEVILSSEASKVPEWLKEAALVVVRSTWGEDPLIFGNALRVESIVYDADRSRVSMGVRIMHASTSVEMSFEVA